MNIVFLAPFGIRPKGTLIARMLPLALALQGRGHTVTIIAPPYTNPEDSGRDEIVNGVKIRNVQLSPGGKVLSAPFIAWRMYCAAMAEKPDIVHLFKPKGYGGLAALIISLFHKKLPLFIDTDDWEGNGGMNEIHNYSSIEKKVYAWQESSLLQSANAITVASKELLNMVKQLGISEKRVIYLPNCVEPKHVGNRIATRKTLSIGENVPVIILYTRFFEFDQELLHSLFAEIAGQLPYCRLLVMGKGRFGEENKLQKAAQDLGFVEQLQQLGWIEPDQIPNFLAIADVAIYPFRDDLVNRTKCPAKLTELMAAGCAVVAHNVGQLAEYIENGKSGVLCKAGDWQEMAAQVVFLLNNAEKRNAMGLAARERMLKHFSWSESAMMLEAFYNHQRNV